MRMLFGRFKCPDCGARYRNYYDGHDCICGAKNLCWSCYTFLHIDPFHRAVHDPNFKTDTEKFAEKVARIIASQK